MTQRYVVQTRFIHGWENCWTDENDNPITFDDFWEASNELAKHIRDQREAVANGNMDEVYNIEDYRVVLETEETK
jgi:hypothetical protein